MAEKAESKALVAVVTTEKRLEDVENAILALDARIDLLKGRNKAIVKAFRKGANEIRPLFGLGSVAVVLDGIADRVDSE